jgi:shikimate kinase
VTIKSRDARLAINEGDPIFLAGFMGAGKTAVGRELARVLGYRFLDLDASIEERAEKSVREIFTQLGEAEFRRLESEAIRSLAELKLAVVALGGGAYQSEPNRAALRAIGVTVWLDCPFEVCFERIKGGISRPLLAGESELRELFDGRRAAYSAADYVVETGSLPPEKVATQIIAKLTT